ncbi:hypothetical protein PR202_gb17981 [Eleusine coracana subsp. coracana]|uniref:YEATS domain-containing protein n=1 Tax=Eleusine coracana subsp. coracana TaxID=191504 RepID=A0AAV5F5Y2_ELECO|nr:hypothetical protein PR202_gb17981 [Eleusine coracana subsp. coracana]
MAIPSHRRRLLLRPCHRRFILDADPYLGLRRLTRVLSTDPLLQCSSCVVTGGAMDASKSKKLKDVEISFPIVYGTISFWLGKKASEYNSHKWTVYVRSATNEDLSVIVKRAVFQLHPSFHNPTRVVEQPPFELSESGWGEFEIAITLYFHSDVCESAWICSIDIVPYEKKRGDTKDHPLSQWFKNFSEADELLKLAAARQQVQAHIAKLRRQLSMMEGMPQQSKALSVPGQQFGHM